MSQAALFASERQPSAVFNGPYRYFLEWPTGLENDRALCAVMANPSKAGQVLPDGTVRSDPTVSRMRGLARQLGFGWLWVVNARSFVATDPSELPSDPTAIGPETDRWIHFAVSKAALVVVAYGHLAGERAPRVLDLVRQAGKVPHALALTADGTPRHPRGVPASARPFPMEAP